MLFDYNIYYKNKDNHPRPSNAEKLNENQKGVLGFR